MAVIVGLKLGGLGGLLGVSAAARTDAGVGVLPGVSVGGRPGATAVQAEPRSTNIRNTKNLFIPQLSIFDLSSAHRIRIPFPSGKGIGRADRYGS